MGRRLVLLASSLLATPTLGDDTEPAQTYSTESCGESQADGFLRNLTVPTAYPCGYMTDQFNFMFIKCGMVQQACRKLFELTVGSEEASITNPSTCEAIPEYALALCQASYTIDSNDAVVGACSGVLTKFVPDKCISSQINNAVDFTLQDCFDAVYCPDTLSPTRQPTVSPTPLPTVDSGGRRLDSQTDLSPISLMESILMANNKRRRRRRLSGCADVGAVDESCYEETTTSTMVYTDPNDLCTCVVAISEAWYTRHDDTEYGYDCVYTDNTTDTDFTTGITQTLLQKREECLYVKTPAEVTIDVAAIGISLAMVTGVLGAVYYYFWWKKITR